MKKSILLAGVGGQGVITAANIIANAALIEGHKVITSELHGMAQRGGDVKCAVRIGNVYSPIIPPQTADAIISLEPMEALRNLNVVSKKGVVITDINPIYPPLTSIGIGEYPSLNDIFEKIEKHCRLVKINADEVAKKAGSILTKNIVMIGSFYALDIFPLERKSIIQSISQNIKKEYVDMNIKAFEIGEKEIK
ncbi:MAG: indolepyruvate oxidoreductase subunit beta [Thermoplasmata archaeon]|nr:indolepyruvate oxidoreductase subunit beta [Thermoplasmata archaeon]